MKIPPVETSRLRVGLRLWQEKKSSFAIVNNCLRTLHNVQLLRVLKAGQTSPKAILEDLYKDTRTKDQKNDMKIPGLWREKKNSFTIISKGPRSNKHILLCSVLCCKLQVLLPQSLGRSTLSKASLHDLLGRSTIIRVVQFLRKLGQNTTRRRTSEISCRSGGGRRNI
jgi:hypothetical protein